MAIDCFDPALRHRLAQFRTEREALLERIVTQLQRDERVVAAWLFGSLGRDGADELSDIDLFVVVDDSALPETIAQRREQMAHADPLLLVLEAPQNAPPGGAYNMALYFGIEGPHQVDWYWQARSVAAVPQQTRLLFDRIGLPTLDGPPRFEYQSVPERSVAEAATQSIHLFWVMLLIAAKHMARSPGDGGLGLAAYAMSALQEAAAFCGAALTHPSDDELKVADPAAKIRLLRAVADEAAALMPGLEARGAPVPWDMVGPAGRYLDLIDAIIDSRRLG